MPLQQLVAKRPERAQVGIGQVGLNPALRVGESQVEVEIEGDPFGGSPHHLAVVANRQDVVQAIDADTLPLFLAGLLVTVPGSLLPEGWKGLASPLPLRYPEKFAVALVFAEAEVVRREAALGRLRTPPEDEVAALYEQKHVNEAVNVSMNESEIRGGQMVSALGALIRENDAQLELSSQAPVLAIMSIGSVLLAMIFGVRLSRSISKPMRALADAAERVASGDLASHVEIDLHDASALTQRGCPPETALRILL